MTTLVRQDLLLTSLLQNVHVSFVKGDDPCIAYNVTSESPYFLGKRISTLTLLDIACFAHMSTSHLSESILPTSHTCSFACLFTLILYLVLHTKRLVLQLETFPFDFRALCKLRLVSCLQTYIVISFWYDILCVSQARVDATGN